MALKFSMILEAIDRASAPAKRVRQGIAGLAAGSRKFGAQLRRQTRDVDSGARSLEHYQRRARRLRSVALGRIFQAGADSARRMARDVRKLTSQLKLAERAGKATMRGMKWLGGAALNTAKWAAAAGAAAGGFALFDLFRTAGQFEQYQIMLEGLEGSAAAGKKSFAWIQDFAERTPFEIDKVTEAFLILKNAGLDPMNGSLLASGDAAAGMSRDITASAEAMADAITGEFERLKAFGITVRQQGERVRLQWFKNGKTMEMFADKTDKAGLAIAVAKAWSDKFAGSQERQSKSMFGIISNIRDAYTKFLNMIAEAGVFDRVKSKLDEWKSKLDVMAKDGRLKKWAEVISDKLQKAFDWAVKFVENTDWDAVANDLARIGEAAKVVADAILSIAENWGTVSAIANYSISDLSNDLRNLMGGGKAKAPASGAAAKRAPAKRGPARGPDRWRRNPATLPSAASKAMLQIGGRTEVDIKVHGPASATVRSARSVNQSIPSVVRVGKTMRAAA